MYIELKQKVHAQRLTNIFMYSVHIYVHKYIYNKFLSIYYVIFLCNAL